jgi:hypothetical protein
MSLYDFFLPLGDAEKSDESDVKFATVKGELIERVASPTDDPLI